MNLLTAAGKWRGGERGTMEAGEMAVKKKFTGIKRNCVSQFNFKSTNHLENEE
jgi:hypothetical protein